MSKDWSCIFVRSFSSELWVGFVPFVLNCRGRWLSATGNLCISLLRYVHSCPRYSQNTHTLCGSLLVWTLCSPSVSVDHNFFLWAILFHPLSLSEQVKNKDPLKIATKVTPPSSHSSTVALCPSIFPVIHRLLKLHPAAISRGWYSPVLLCLQQGATLNISSLEQPTGFCNLSRDRGNTAVPYSKLATPKRFNSFSETGFQTG